MKVWTSPLVLASTLLLSQAADGAGIGAQRVISNHHIVPDSPLNDPSSPRLFPFLTKIRDEAIEFFFGRHPTKESRPEPDLKQLRAQYANELVLRFNVTATDEEAALSDAAARLFLDVWAFTNDFVDIRLHANEVAPLLSLLPNSLRASYSTLISDLAAAVYQSLPTSTDPHYSDPQSDSSKVSTVPTSGDNLFFQDYQQLPVIVRWMRLLEAMFPSFVEYITIGKSYEGRDIPGLRLGVPSLDKPAPPRKTIVIVGGVHAREWISTSTVNYLAWSFVTAHGKDAVITKLLKEFDVVFLPILNPDGFEYTWQIDRLWRKTRQQTSLRFCRGMDLDHTFGFEWNSAPSQNDPCSETYGGDEPFQAVEAKVLAEWARKETLNNVRFAGLVDLHSYSQQILIPFSYTCAADPSSMENLQELAAGISKAIRISSGESYTVASACEGAVMAQKGDQSQVQSRIESGGGTALDWFYHEMRARFSYQIKLRDTGSYGFLLPKEHIIPTGEEMFNAMKYYGDYLLGNNGIETWLDDAETQINVSEAAPDNDVLASQELRRRRLRR